MYQTQKPNQSDPYKLNIPEFDHSIFNKTSKIGTNPKDVLTEIGAKAGDVIADFGSGAGFYTMEAAKIVTNSGKVYAIDIDQNILEHLKEKAIESGIKNIYGILTNLEKERSTGLPDGTTDMVMMINLLYLVKNRPMVLGEAHRILKPGGKLVVMDWSEKGVLTMLEKEQLVVGREVKEIATKLGFKKTQTFEAGISHEVNVFVKS